MKALPALIVALFPAIVLAGNTFDPPPEVNPVLRRAQGSLDSTNLMLSGGAVDKHEAQQFEAQLELARREAAQQNKAQAAKLLESLLNSEPPVEIQRSAMLELALMCQAQGQNVKAQQIYTQYVQLYPRDSSVPEVLLRQGLLYRDMGTAEMALAKFYSVMTVVLHLKLDRLAYHQRLVLQAQTEIADTYCAQGKLAEAVGCYRRLLKMDAVTLNVPQIQLKLIRALSRQGAHNEVVTEATEFVRTPGDGLQQAEVRLLMATALQRLGRTQEARETMYVQVLLLADWQAAGSNVTATAQLEQQAGNEIANELFTTGDYRNALELYRQLADLNPSCEWQLPALYQAALVHERLGELEKAADLYARVVRLGHTGNCPKSDPLAFLLSMAEQRQKTALWLLRENAVPQPAHPVAG